MVTRPNIKRVSPLNGPRTGAGLRTWTGPWPARSTPERTFVSDRKLKIGILSSHQHPENRN
jgi:hypothetical protein